MNGPLSLSDAVIAVIVSALVVLSTRVLPFVVFSKKEPPAIIKFIEKYAPPMIMAILVVYCFKDVEYTTAPYGIPYFICVAAAAVLHLVFKNSMVSILGITLFYMILSRLM